MNKIASRYAEALVAIALDVKRLDEFKAQAKVLYKVFRENPDYVGLFSKPQLSIAEKRELLDSVLAKQIDPYWLNLLKLLVEKRRSNLLEAVTLDFIHLANVAQGIEEGIVYSVYPLSDADLKDLEVTYSAQRKTTVEFLNKIDLTLISGIKIRFNESVIDLSLSAQLDALRGTLREGRS
jgi:F-type H+-transporting ATPase subunit delta